MVELQEATFATAPAIAGDESAAVLISFRDRSLDVRGLDAVERGVLGEPEYVEAVFERRGKALAFEETACVELGEVGDERHRRFALAVGETRDLGEKLGVGERRGVCDRHGH